MELISTHTKKAWLWCLLLCLLTGNATVWAQDTQETISLIELTGSSAFSPDYTIEQSENDTLTYNIPSYLMISKSKKGQPIIEVSLETFVSGGEKPYTFKKISGPDWMTVSSEGVVSGTPTVVGPNPNLVTEVTDQTGQSIQASLKVGDTELDPADREKITEMETTSDDFSTIPKYGGNCSYVTFTVTKGSPAYVNTTMGSWRKKEGDTWQWNSPENVFTTGTYRYEVQIRVDNEAGKTHVLGEGFTFKMNGENWTVLDPLTVNNTSSYVWVAGPEITITEPVGEPLNLNIPSIVKIENIYKGTAMKEISIKDYAWGGEKPYTFSKTSGPEWINVSSEGVISGTPTVTGTNENLVVRVTDKAGTFKEATIAVGETKMNPEDREDVTLVEATSEDLNTIPSVGNKCGYVSFTMSSGSKARILYGNGNWYKVGENNELSRQSTSDTFTEGDYRYMAVVMLDGEYGKTYKLADFPNLTVTVNGEKWQQYTYVTYEDNRSFARFISPVITITGTGIGNITADDKPAVRYNMRGQRVDKNYKGVVIINGKKYVKR